MKKPDWAERLQRTFQRRYEAGYDAGWTEGVIVGVKASRHVLYKDLKRIGSTGDYLEVPWADVAALLGIEED